MRKSAAFGLVFLLLASSVLVIGPGTQDASASTTTTTFNGETSDGYLQKAGASWGSWTSTTPSAFGSIMKSGSDATKSLSREYLSFDTSSIPDGSFISSANLKLVCGSLFEDPSSVNIYAGSWGAALDASDWGCGSTSGTFVSTLSGTYYGTQYSVTVTSSLISLTGRTQFEIRLTDESNPGASQYQNNFYTANHTNAAYRPVLEVTYGTIDKVTYVMDGGATHEFDAVAQVQSYNDTHDMAMYEFDTWSGVANIYVPIPSGWTFFSFTPWSNYTLTSSQLNITDVRDGQTYRVYFTYEKTESVQVHVSIYVASTGEGLAFETFRMRYSSGLTYNSSLAQDIVASNFQVEYGASYTIVVLDYFGNEIETQSFVANALNKYISIPLDIYSLKCFNQQEDFSRLRIYYNNTGAALTFFCAPMEPVERFVRPGPYTIVVTNYPGGVASASQYFNISVSDAEYFKLNGTTISRVISDVAGVAAMQTVITNLVTPDMVFVKEDMPSVPTEAVQYIHPWSVVTATTEANASGTSMAFWLPYPGASGTTYTILSDKLYVSGNYTADIWVNSTAPAALFYSANLPSSIALNGQNVTVAASESITVQRVTTYRAEDLFYWAYYTSQKLYEVTLDVNNTMSENMSDIDWFIGFAENCSIDLASVTVYDIDNAVELEAGLNYDITTAGVRMHLDTLAAGDQRSFKLTCYDSNSTSGQSVPIAYVDTYEKVDYGGEDYCKAQASWISSYSATYEGQLNIKLDFTNVEYLDAASVIVIDTSANQQLTPQEWYITGNVITISHVNVAPGAAKTYDIMFTMDYTQSGGWDPYEPLTIIGGFPITPILVGWALIVVVAGLAVGDWFQHRSWSGRWVGAFFITFAIVAFTSLLYGGA